MNILVTGGAGFIGSNYVRYVLENHPEDQVVNLDVLTYAGNLENLKDFENNPNYTFVRGDITDRDLVMDLVKDVDAIVNVAAETHVDRSIIDSGPFVQTNMKGTQVLLDAALKYGKKLRAYRSSEAGLVVNMLAACDSSECAKCWSCSKSRCRRSRPWIRWRASLTSSAPTAANRYWPTLTRHPRH